MGQVAACATVNHCCSSPTQGENGPIVEPSAVLRVANLPPDVRLVAFIRRRSGADCDFGEVFEELFGCRDAVGESKFTSVLKERGAGHLIDAHAAFMVIDRQGRGTVSAPDFEAWQEEMEKKEVDGLRVWRDWLRKRFTTPSAAFHAMGKGEGDVLIEVEFTESLERLGFVTDEPLDLFRFVDKDFSGEITFAEFKSAMRSVGSERIKVKELRRAGDRSRNTSKTNSLASSPRQDPEVDAVAQKQSSGGSPMSGGTGSDPQKESKDKGQGGRRKSLDDTAHGGSRLQTIPEAATAGANSSGPVRSGSKKNIDVKEPAELPAGEEEGGN